MSRIFIGLSMAILVVGTTFSQLAHPLPPPQTGRQTIERPISDWLENNPHEVNFFGPDYLINIGWNPHGFPDLEGNQTDPVNSALFNPNPDADVDRFAYPGGFDSILAAVEGDTVTTGHVLQFQLQDGGVKIIVTLNISNAPMSVYRTSDVLFAETACSLAPNTHGPGCNGESEPAAILGQDADGSWDYTLQVQLRYTAEAVAAAGGDLDAGINPKIPFLLPAAFGAIPGVSVQNISLAGTGMGTFTPYATYFGFTAGATGRASASGLMNVAENPTPGGVWLDVHITEE